MVTIIRLTCDLAPVVANKKPDLLGYSTEIPAAAVAAVRWPEKSRNRLPGDASSLPEAGTGRLLLITTSPLTMGDLWKGDIFSLGG